MGRRGAKGKRGEEKTNAIHTYPKSHAVSSLRYFRLLFHGSFFPPFVLLFFLHPLRCCCPRPFIPIPCWPTTFSPFRTHRVPSSTHRHSPNRWMAVLFFFFIFILLSLRSFCFCFNTAEFIAGFCTYCVNWMSFFPLCGCATVICWRICVSARVFLFQ